MWKLVGGVIPNTPPYGPKNDLFTSVEGNRANFNVPMCKWANGEHISSLESLLEHNNNRALYSV